MESVEIPGDGRNPATGGEATFFVAGIIGRIQRNIAVEWSEINGQSQIPFTTLKERTRKASLVLIDHLAGIATVKDITAETDRLEISDKFLADIWKANDEGRSDDLAQLMDEAFDYMADSGVIGAVAKKSRSQQ